MKAFRIIVGLGLIVCLLPIAGILVSTAIASAYGCALDEGGAHPCMIMGGDWGNALTEMFVSGWFMFVTLPAAAALVALWLLVEAVRTMRRRTA